MKRAEELAERVRQHLRDAGYWNPAAEEPRVSKIAETPAGRFADVTVQVNPGAVYTLGEITFENVKAFPRDQLRAQFHSRTGEHVNATEIGRGLDNLRNLYASKGYANFGAIPKAMIDESRYVIDLTVDVDEGRPCSFGGFALEGVEPVAGAGKLLLDSWKKDMRGKLYNPELLKAWLVANTANWPDDSAARVHLDSGCGGTADAMALNVILHFQ